MFKAIFGMCMRKIPVGILGATGIIGQHYLALLQNHPWFEVTFLAASQEGSYEDRVRGRWNLESPIPKNLHLNLLDSIDPAQKNCACVFSALPNDQAKIYEERYANAGLPVISNASHHRQTPDVPLLIPEVNPHHTAIIFEQQKKRGWKKGFIVTKPNCSLQSFVIPLAPLHSRFKIQKIHVTTLQAISGAGLTGLSSHAIHDNVIPFIEGEEEKSEREPLKIWGDVHNNAIRLATQLSISAHCNRVPVLDGHMACVSVSFEKKPSFEEILDSWKRFTPCSTLPSAPVLPILYRNEPERPQTRLDRLSSKGMAITVGRLRSCPLLDFRFVGVSHNAIRGGAGGGVLIAEQLYEKGFLQW